MLYSFVAEIIRERFMQDPFNGEHPYLVLPIEGLTAYRCVDLCVGIPRTVVRSPIPAAGAGHELNPLLNEFLEDGETDIRRTFEEKDGGVVVFEMDASWSVIYYHYDDGERLSRIEEIVVSGEPDNQGLEEFETITTLLERDTEGRLVSVERNKDGEPADRSSDSWCKATIEYRAGGDLVFLSIEPTQTEPAEKHAWMFSCGENSGDIAHEFLVREPGVPLDIFADSRAEFEAARNFSLTFGEFRACSLEIDYPEGFDDDDDEGYTEIFTIYDNEETSPEEDDDE